MNASSRFAVVLSSLLALGAWADAPRPPPGIAFHAPVHQQDSVDAKLQRAQALLEGALRSNGNGNGHGHGKQRAMKDALEEIAAARAELSMRGNHGPPPPPRGPQVMRADSFNALVAALDHERNPESQLVVLGNAAAGNMFRTGQVQTLLSRFTFDAFRLRAAGMLSSKLVDPNNAFTLYATLPGAFDKQVMQQLLAGGNANQLVVAANDLQLRTLTNAVAHSWMPADRLATLNARAGDQLVSTAQLKRLLELFSSGRDRLAALTSMKRRLVDPHNAPLLTQSFWSAADQREARRLLGA